MKFEKIFPETLLELTRKELDKSSNFEYIEGIQRAAGSHAGHYVR